MSQSKERRIRFATLVASLATAQLAFAQSSAPDQSTTTQEAGQGGEWRNVTFGATLETYYQFNWNRVPDRTLALRAYDTRANTFSIQQAAFVADAPPDVTAGRRYGGRLDLQFGQATATVQGNAENEPRPDLYRYLWQVYGSYVFPAGSSGLQVDVGKFASMLGYETNYAKDNQAFSRAFLFNFLPFYHAGVRVSLPVHPRFTVLYMLTNGVQQTEDFNDFKSSHIAAVLKPIDAVMWTVNYYRGQEQPDGGAPGGPDGRFTVLDTYVTATPMSALTLGVDINYTSNQVARHDSPHSLSGLGVYARYQLTSPTALGVRFERLDDEGLVGAIQQTLNEITLTAEHRLGEGLLVRAEWRRDGSDHPVFPGPAGAADLRRRQPTFLVGGVWVLGTKKGAW